MLFARKIKMKCIKSIFKSTYRKNAFHKGRVYEVVLEDDYTWLRDNEFNEFSFVREEKYGMYLLSDYFVPVK
jgi:hypothetical protein